jgi:hypothetical protein
MTEEHLYEMVFMGSPLWKNYISLTAMGISKTDAIDIIGYFFYNS